MTRREILKNRLEMARHNLYCASDDYAMSRAKEGYEAEYKEALEEVKILESWVKEFPSRREDGVREFVGHISATSYKKNIYGRAYMDEVEFGVETGEGIAYADDRIFHAGKEVQDWFIGDDGSGCGRYDTEKDSQNSVLVKIEVDSINCIRSIEWAE